MTQLEVDMARTNHSLSRDVVAEWIRRSSALSSELNDTVRQIDGSIGDQPITQEDLDEGFKRFRAELVRDYKASTGNDWDTSAQGPR